MALLFAFGVAGCDALEDINPFSNEKEVKGVVEAIGASSLTVDGIEYAVTDKTEFEGSLNGLSDLSVGVEVEIDYKEKNSRREAVEVGLASEDD